MVPAIAVTETLISEMVLVAASKCSLDADILSGSCAGAADENSGVDLMIVRARPFHSGPSVRRNQDVKICRDDRHTGMNRGGRSL